MTKNYVDKEIFYDEMTSYKQQCQDAENSGEPEPKIPDYIGKCFYDISTRLAYRPNFINYPFRDEMVADGMENAVRACKNFNPDHSKKNPFGYFTRIIYFAFLRRIWAEKLHMYHKFKAMENSVVFDLLQQDSDFNNVDIESFDLDNEYMNTFIKNMEEALEKRKVKRAEAKKRGLEKFMTEDRESIGTIDKKVSILDDGDDE